MQSISVISMVSQCLYWNRDYCHPLGPCGSGRTLLAVDFYQCYC